MDCKDVKELLGALADGEVSDSEREALLSHIAECETCKNEYEDIQNLKKEFSKLDVQLRGALADSVMKKIYAEAYPKKKKPFFFKYAGTAAAVAIIAIAAIYMGTTPQNDKAECNSAEDVTVTLQASDKLFSDDAMTERVTESTQDGSDYEFSSLGKQDSSTSTNTEAEENKEVPKADAKGEAVELPSSEPAESLFDEPMSSAPDILKSEDITLEEPPCEPESDDISLEHFRFYNSISLDTAIIFVDSEVETVAPLLDNVSSVSGSCINVDSHHSAVMDILISNSIPITKTDIPEGSTETTVFAE